MSPSVRLIPLSNEISMESKRLISYGIRLDAEAVMHGKEIPRDHLIFMGRWPIVLLEEWNPKCSTESEPRDS